ncbi:MAG: type II toxin-antitoxin system VapC family toxin [Alphaproteobacteria bacterium]|nr:type II toxin-antitoxin system VapC family toxin [Alphaproteobacteria bacterium]
MSDKVVDASALAALIFGEPEEKEIEARLAGHRLIAPTLLPFEMSSVCLKKLRKNPTARTAILARFAKLPSFPIDFYEVDPAATVEAAELLSLSAYDASYLLLARHMRAELVTLDTKLNAAI